MTASDRNMTGRGGYTLLELVMSSAILAAVLVPALALMKQSMEIGREVDTRNMLATLCVGKMEEHLALAAAGFTEATDSGVFAAAVFPEASPNLHYDVTRSTNPADGGIADQLMAINATVWHDTNGDGSQQSGEPAIAMSTKVAKMALYQIEAGGS